ncbi:helix-turn-helix transcriptional regulator [Paraburkholderia flava]|uniref:helix-turn-helix transcriptional regulator n=1 Tax=Paraburkholderia flava TaxID=2547393 RepID=UPI00105F99DF|nr:AlpA family phage regulatory protein [Paraburkholderia flava]
MTTRFIRLPELMERTGLPESTIYWRMNHGTWIRPVKIGLRAVAWLAHEIDALCEAMANGKTHDEIVALIVDLTAARSKSKSAE